MRFTMVDVHGCSKVDGLSRNVTFRGVQLLKRATAASFLLVLLGWLQKSNLTTEYLLLFYKVI